MTNQQTLSFSQQFLGQVEAFLAETNTDPTRFGIDAMNDPSFVFELREGRSCRSSTMDKVLAYIAERRKSPPEKDGKES